MTSAVSKKDRSQKATMQSRQQGKTLALLLSEANRIKDRLRACTTVEEVKQVADEERDTVMSWQGKEGTEGAMFHHIVNLKKYMISGFEMKGES